MGAERCRVEDGKFGGREHDRECRRHNRNGKITVRPQTLRDLDEARRGGQKIETVNLHQRKCHAKRE